MSLGINVPASPPRGDGVKRNSVCHQGGKLSPITYGHDLENTPLTWASPPCPLTVLNAFPPGYWEQFPKKLVALSL